MCSGSHVAVAKWCTRQPFSLGEFTAGYITTRLMPDMTSLANRFANLELGATTLYLPFSVIVNQVPTAGWTTCLWLRQCTLTRCKWRCCQAQMDRRWLSRALTQGMRHSQHHASQSSSRHAYPPTAMVQLDHRLISDWSQAEAKAASETTWDAVEEGHAPCAMASTKGLVACYSRWIDAIAIMMHVPQKAQWFHRQAAAAAKKKAPQFNRSRNHALQSNRWWQCLPHPTRPQSGDRVRWQSSPLDSRLKLLQEPECSIDFDYSFILWWVVG